MSFDSKMAEAVKSIEGFNAKVAESKRVNLETFKEILQDNGGVDDESLCLISWEDLEGMGLPKLLAKRVAEIFRAKTSLVETDSKPVFYTEARVKSMTMEQLVRAYDPSESDNAVGSRLKAVSKGSAFLVFVNGVVHVPSSVQLLEELRKEFPPRSLYTLEGVPYQVYPVGSRPQDVMDENPLYPGNALRPDGTCDKTSMSWNGVPMKVRILARLGVTQGVFKVNDVNSARDVMDKVLRDDAEKYFTTRFPELIVRYSELEGLGQLPNLKMKRQGGNSQSTVAGLQSSGVQIPFGIGNKQF